MWYASAWRIGVVHAQNMYTHIANAQFNGTLSSSFALSLSPSTSLLPRQGSREKSSPTDLSAFVFAEVIALSFSLFIFANNCFWNFFFRLFSLVSFVITPEAQQWKLARPLRWMERQSCDVWTPRARDYDYIAVTLAYGSCIKRALYRKTLPVRRMKGWNGRCYRVRAASVQLAGWGLTERNVRIRRPNTERPGFPVGTCETAKVLVARPRASYCIVPAKFKCWSLRRRLF